jgi:hypothetical protein
MQTLSNKQNKSNPAKENKRIKIDPSIEGPNN